MDLELSMAYLAKKATFRPYAFYGKPFVGLYVNGTQYPAFPRFDSHDAVDSATYAGVLSEQTRIGGTLHLERAEAKPLFNRSVCLSPRFDPCVLRYPGFSDLDPKRYLKNTLALRKKHNRCNGGGNYNGLSGGGDEDCGAGCGFTTVAADCVPLTTVHVSPYRFITSHPSFESPKSVRTKFGGDCRFAYTSEHVNFYSDAWGANNLTQTTTIPPVSVPLPFAHVEIAPSQMYLMFGMHCEGSFSFTNLSGTGHVPLDKHTAARRGVRYLRCYVALDADSDYHTPHTYRHDFDLRQWNETRSPHSDPGSVKTVLVPLNYSGRALCVGDRFSITLYALPEEDGSVHCDRRHREPSDMGADPITEPFLLCRASIVLTAATYVHIDSINSFDGTVASYTEPATYSNFESFPKSIHPRAVNLGDGKKVNVAENQTTDTTTYTLKKFESRLQGARDESAYADPSKRSRF